MKKAIVLLLALVIVGAFAFADDAAAAPAKPYTLTGDATGGWFYNITSGNSGFSNSCDFDFKYTLLDTSESKKGEGTYGEIDITHLTIRSVEDSSAPPSELKGGFLWTLGDYSDNAPTISAKIVSGALTVGLYGAPSADYTNAVYVPLFSSSAGYTNGSALEPKLAPSAGVTVGYSFGDLGSATLSLGSSPKAAASAAVAAVPASSVVYIATGAETAVAGVSYTTLNGVAQALPLTIGVAYIKVTAATAAVAAGTADKNYYLGGIDFAINPVKDMVSVVGGFWYDPQIKKSVFTGKATFTMGDLSANAAIDGQKVDTGSVQFDWSSHVAYALFDKKDSINFDSYWSDQMDTAGIAAETNPHQTDIGFKYVDAAGLVPGLGFTVGVFGMDLTDATKADPMYLSFAESANYSIGDTKIKPYEAFYYDMHAKASYIDLGIEYDAVANTAIKFDFAMGGTANDNNVGLTNAGTDSVITISAEVTL